MDLGYASGKPPRLLPPELTAASTRAAEFLGDGGRAAVLTGPCGSGKAAVLERLLAGMPGRVLHVCNPGQDALDLPAILRQLGRVPAEPADEQGLFYRTLAELAYDDYSAVLAIEDAHTLTSVALAALSRVPGLGGPDLPGLILLLSGEPPLLEKMAAPGLELLRNSRRTLLLKLPEAGAPATQAAGPSQVGAAPPSMPRRLTRDILLAAAAAMAGAILAAAALGGQAAPPGAPPPATAALPDPPAATLPPASVDPVPPPPALAADPLPAAETLPPPATTPEQQLRQDFDAFLARAGRDTARLTPAARQALFDEYLRWRARPPVARARLRP